MNRTAFAALLALSTWSFAAQADEVDSYIDLFALPIAQLDLTGGGSSLSGDGYGYGLKGAVSVTEFLYGRGEYMATRQDLGGDINYDVFRLGVGTVFPLDLGFLESVNADVEYINAQLGPLNEDGYGVHVGVTGNAMSWLAVYGQLGYIDVSLLGDGPEFLLGASGNATEKLGWFLDYRMAQLEDTAEVETGELRVGVRLILGSTGHLFGEDSTPPPTKTRRR